MERLIEVVEIHPDNVEFEGIMEVIYVQQKIAQGLAQLDAGNFVMHEEMKARVKTANFFKTAAGGKA